MYYTVSGFENGCPFTAKLVVTVNPTPVIGSNPTIVNAKYNLNNGRIVLVVSNGAPGYNYSWVSLPGNAAFGNSLSMDFLALGQYQLTVTDVNSCSVKSSV